MGKKQNKKQLVGCKERLDQQCMSVSSVATSPLFF